MDKNVQTWKERHENSIAYVRIHIEKKSRWDETSLSMQEDENVEWKIRHDVVKLEMPWKKVNTKSIMQ